LTRSSRALPLAACLALALFVLPASAAGRTTTTGEVAGDSHDATAAATQECVEARAGVRRARRALVRAREALAEAETRGEKRRARRRVRRRKNRLENRKEARAEACAEDTAPPVDPPNGEPQPEPEPDPAPANRAPQFPATVQSSSTTSLLYDPISGFLTGALTTINVLTPATDPDGDPITYTWSATNGSITGTGLSASWQRLISLGLPTDGDATIAASDGRGGSDTFTFRFL
jgi:hypothetical protein